MLGQIASCGTGDYEILLDEEYLYELMKDNKFKVDNQYYENDDNNDNDNDCELEDITFDYEITKKNKKCVTFNNKVIIKD